jgi:hypothetical protein
MTEEDKSKTLVKIQTVSLVGLLLIAVVGLIAYGCQRKQESDRLETLRNLSCGRFTASVLIEAQELWDEGNAIRANLTAHMLEPERLAAFNQKHNELTSEHLRGVETFCDPDTIKRITETVKTKYPGLTRW